MAIVASGTWSALSVNFSAIKVNFASNDIIITLKQHQIGCLYGRFALLNTLSHLY